MFAILGIVAIIGSFGAVVVPEMVHGSALDTKHDKEQKELVREIRDSKNEKPN